MLVRLLRRLLLGLVTMSLSTLALYVAIRLVPGAPFPGGDATRQSLVDAWRRQYHLDRPILVGYGLWLRGAAAGDLGSSLTLARGEPVAALVARGAPISLLLGALGVGTALSLAVACSFASARRPGGAWDRIWSLTLFVLNAAPTFWVAMILQDVFTGEKSWLRPFGTGPVDPPAGGPIVWAAARIPFWILPPACLALGSMAFFFRFTRASLLEGAASRHVLAARTRGLPELFVMGRHAFAVARLHMVTLLGLLTPSIIGGSIVVERVFDLPGLGQLFLDAAAGRDYPVMMGVGLLMAAASVVGSVAADLLSGFADPRLHGPAEARP